MYFSGSGPSLLGGETGAKATATSAPRGRRAHALALGQAGNTLLQVIVILFVLIISVYFISDRLITQKNVVLQTSSMLRVRFALHSIMDYMYFHISRRSCLDENLLANQTNCQLGTMVGNKLANTTAELQSGPHILAPNAKGGNARSLERVLLSYNLAHNMESMIDLSCVDLQLERNFKPNGTGPTSCNPVIGSWNTGTNPKTLVYNESAFTQVDTMEIVVAAKSISQGHPLYPVIAPLYQALMDELITKTATTVTRHDFFIRVNVHRDTEGNPPVSGSETYFLVTVRLEDENHKEIVANRIPLQLQSYGTLFPREVGSFALMVPRDLRLDGAPVAAPNIEIPALANWNRTNTGLIFQSPVFVNGDLHLPTPASGNHYQGGGNVSPVTFGDRVILGNGWIYDGNNLYQPDSAGGKTDSLWSDNRMLGGLKMGALIDNAWDKGLMMYGEFDVGSVDNAIYQRCLTRYNLEATPNPSAKLYASEEPKTDGSFDWMLGIVDPASVTTDSRTAMNFYPLPDAVGAPDPGPMWDATRSIGTSSSTSTSVNGAVVELGVSVGTQTAVARMPIDSTLVVTPAVGDQADTKFIAKILKDDFSKSPQLQALKAQSTSTDTAIATAAKAAIDKLKDAYANPGTIQVSVKSVKYETDLVDTPPNPLFPLYEKHLVELNVKFTNPENFLDGNGPGNLMAPKVRVIGFDNRFRSGVGSANQPDNVNRTIVFKNDAGGVSLPSPYLMLPNGNPAPMDPYGTGTGQILINDEYPQFPQQANYDAAAYLNFDALCHQNDGKANGQSFGAAAWNVDFSPDGAHVRSSWNAANDTTTNYSDANLRWGSGSNDLDTTLPPVGEIYCPSGQPTAQSGDDTTRKYAMCDVQFDGGNSKIAGVPGAPSELPSIDDKGHAAGRDDFRAFTIVQNCHIENDAELVTGFFTCDTLEIKAGRQKPLYIIGTFIVRNLIFDDETNAMSKGIHWMSIYHPDATGILRASRVLRRTSNPTLLCDDSGFTGLPIWDISGMSLQKQQDLRTCNVISLRAKSDNFRWTAVDPDCGHPAGSSGQLCKRHPVNYLVMEHGRGGGP